MIHASSTQCLREPRDLICAGRLRFPTRSAQTGLSSLRTGPTVPPPLRPHSHGATLWACRPKIKTVVDDLLSEGSCARVATDSPFTAHNKTFTDTILTFGGRGGLTFSDAGISGRASGNLARDRLASQAVNLRLRLWPTIPIPRAKPGDQSPRRRRAWARDQYAPSMRYLVPARKDLHRCDRHRLQG